MLLCAVSVLVVAQSSSEIPERLMNNPVVNFLVITFPFHLMSHNSNNWKSWNKPNFCVRLLRTPTEEERVFKGKNQNLTFLFWTRSRSEQKMKARTKGQRKRMRRGTWLLLHPQGLSQCLDPHYFTRGYKINLKSYRHGARLGTANWNNSER